MENADNRRELHARAGDCGVLDIDRAHPFATRLDDVFLAVGDAHEAVLVYRGDIASVEPAVRIQCARIAEIVALDHPGSADEDRSGTLPVARQLLPLFINNLQFDAELAAALPRPDGVVEHVLPGFGELWRGRGQYAQRVHIGPDRRMVV